MEEDELEEMTERGKLTLAATSLTPGTVALVQDEILNLEISVGITHAYVNSYFDLVAQKKNIC